MNNLLLLLRGTGVGAAEVPEIHQNVKIAAPDIIWFTNLFNIKSYLFCYIHKRTFVTRSISFSCLLICRFTKHPTQPPSPHPPPLHPYCW